MSASVHLHLGLALSDTWREVARPWFDRAVGAALATEAPWAVLTPSRSLGLALKARLLAEGRSVGGLYFWTPGDVRNALRQAAATSGTVAVREHLHLLLASVATGSDERPAAAVARDPARLLRSLDQLQAAGHPARELGFPPAEKMATACATGMQAAGWTTVQQYDWNLARHPPAGALGGLLVLGFDAAHWELWPLLQAAVQSAAEVHVVLTRPRSKAEDLDQAWVGTWEEAFGEAAPVDEAGEPGTFAALAQQMENPEGDTGSATHEVRVLIGRHVREQATAVVAQCAAWLATESVSQLGILLPGPGPLAREISLQLRTRGLAHFDSFGHPAQPSVSAQRWRAWTTLQRTFRLRNLRAVLDLTPTLPAPDGWERHVERALGDVLVDDLDVLSARVAHTGHEPDAAFLRRFAALPAQGTLHDLLEATRQAWHTLGWPDVQAILEPQASAVAALSDRTLTAALFLDWLEAVAPGPAQLRDPESGNPLARIHLLPYTQAEGLTWSHLILADLNEGQWPPSFETPSYLSDRQITALNRSVLATGRQGEGHIVVKNGHALMLGPNERRALCRRQFYNLVESARAGLALVCALESEDGKGRILPASDFLSHLYFVAFREPLTEKVMHARQAVTAQWLANLPTPDTADHSLQALPVDRVAEAYAQRRVQEPFGRYECAFTSPPAQAIALSCKEWQDALVDPAAVWMKYYLGVAAASDADRDRWPMTRGSWVHAWLARALVQKSNHFAIRAQGSAILEATGQAARRTRDDIAASFAKAHRALPDWWRARWAQAEWLARQFARRLADLPDWPWAATEWSLPKQGEVRCGDVSLRLRGRLDVLLSRQEPAGIPEYGWLADFKTGSDKKLSAKNYGKQFLSGEGVQLALYALALEAAGVREVYISLLNADTEVEPQISLTEVHGAQPMWNEFARMQATGIFGLRGAVRSEFGRSVVLPLATLAVDEDGLEEKWRLTHPDLAEADEAAE